MRLILTSQRWKPRQIGVGDHPLFGIQSNIVRQRSHDFGGQMLLNLPRNVSISGHRHHFQPLRRVRAGSHRLIVHRDSNRDARSRRPSTLSRRAWLGYQSLQPGRLAIEVFCPLSTQLIESIIPVHVSIMASMTRYVT